MLFVPGSWIACTIEDTELSSFSQIDDIIKAIVIHIIHFERSDTTRKYTTTTHMHIHTRKSSLRIINIYKTSGIIDSDNISIPIMMKISQRDATSRKIWYIGNISTRLELSSEILEKL